MTNDPKITGKLCINLQVDTNKCKRDYVAYLYNIARRGTSRLGRLRRR